MLFLRAPSCCSVVERAQSECCRAVLCGSDHLVVSPYQSREPSCHVDASYLGVLEAEFITKAGGVAMFTVQTSFGVAVQRVWPLQTSWRCLFSSLSQMWCFKLLAFCGVEVKTAFQWLWFAFLKFWRSACMRACMRVYRCRCACIWRPTLTVPQLLSSFLFYQIGPITGLELVAK